MASDLTYHTKASQYDAEAMPAKPQNGQLLRNTHISYPKFLVGVNTHN